MGPRGYLCLRCDVEFVASSLLASPAVISGSEFVPCFVQTIAKSNRSDRSCTPRGSEQWECLGWLEVTKDDGIAVPSRQ
ncbi:unnamed protein product [Musa acuminata subsp. malaccensis]|uniref:(wild Malaysian banana) hypothetical protein n=1 Tax=Musa acuminata subsp. malaccensis TaxID=214687 RepID=A0A804ICB8_MUSAM|nr:unnamed protein product [Musa acuminata subsp. malaccensis]